MLYKNGLGGTFYNPCYNQEEKGKDQKLKVILATYGLGDHQPGVQETVSKQKHIHSWGHTWVAHLLKHEVSDSILSKYREKNITLILHQILIDLLVAVRDCGI